jgi:hypothetical protein
MLGDERIAHDDPELAATTDVAFLPLAADGWAVRPSPIRRRWRGRWPSGDAKDADLAVFPLLLEIPAACMAAAVGLTIQTIPIFAVTRDGSRSAGLRPPA